MRLLSSFGIRCYALFIRIASLFNPKAKAWVEGRSKWKSKLLKAIPGNAKTIWFHAASLGEFEMGRPVLEQLKQDHPEYFILVTFFSPSGYEHRKDTPLADFVAYMPIDTIGNAKRFLKIVNPALAIFVKYDFWPNYLHFLNKRNTPIAFISATFRKDQFLFSTWGSGLKKLVAKAAVITVQNQASLEILQQNGLNNGVVCGDVRMDNVLVRSTEERNFTSVERFIDGYSTFIAGSCWPKDEEVFLPLIMRHTSLRFILAPHDVSAQNIDRLISKLPCPAVKYTELDQTTLGDHRVLVIDCIGVLSSIYRLADYAFVGGGYKEGLHNILEPAVFGIPVFFGHLKHNKFWEARAMIEAGGAFEVADFNALNALITPMINDDSKRVKVGKAARQFVENNAGSTSKTIDAIYGIVKL